MLTRHLNQGRRWLLSAACVALLAGCGARGLVRPDLAGNNKEAPKQVLVVPADFVITEITFGKTEERVVSAERKASKTFTQHVQELGVSKENGKERSFDLIDFDQLTQDEQETVLQHRALFATMVSQMLLVKEDAVDAWATKAKYFDYTLGAGMADLAKAHQLDRALFVVGKDKVRSTSRKVFDAVTSVLPIGESLSSQPAAVVLGVVELQTGNILMFDSDMAKRKALTDDDDVKAMAEAVLTDFRRTIKPRDGSK